MYENSLEQQPVSYDTCVARRPVCASAIRRLIACAVLALGAIPAVAAESAIQAVAGKPESTVILAPAVEPVADSAAADPPPPPAQTAESIAAILAEPEADLRQIEAQIDAGEFATSRVWLEARIATIEEASHRFDPDLVRPITLLGDVFVGQGDFTAALDNYGRAVHVQRVSAGLVSADPVEIVYREADVYRALGDW